MVADEFMIAIEKVYGNYENPTLKAVVKKYLIEDIAPDKLAQLYRTVLYGHKANFGAPCIATIEECIYNARQRKNKFEPYRIKQANSCKENILDEKKAIPDEEFIECGNVLTDLFKAKEI